MSKDANDMAEHFNQNMSGGLKANGFSFVVDDAMKTVHVRCTVCESVHATLFGGNGARNIFSNFKLKHVKTNGHQQRRDASAHISSTLRVTCGRPAASPNAHAIPSTPLQCTLPTTPVTMAEQEVPSTDPFARLHGKYPDKFRVWRGNSSKAECVICGTEIKIGGNNLLWNAKEHLDSPQCKPRQLTVADHFAPATASAVPVPLPDGALQTTLVCKGMWQMSVKHERRGCYLGAASA